jgi:hypothetical protein
VKKLLACLALTIAVVSSLRASISLDVSSGILTNSDGSVVVTDGKLFQIIASPDAVFSAPTTTSFLGNGSNDIVLWSGALNSSTNDNTPGSMVVSLSNIDLSTYPVANDYIIIRWFPSLDANASTPGTTTYGEYGFGYTGGSSWKLGASGSYSLSLVTTSAGGSSANSLGYASKITAVPEPSSYAVLVGLFSLGLFVWHGRRKTSVA